MLRSITSLKLLLLCSVIVCPASIDVETLPMQVCFSFRKALNGFQLNGATPSHPPSTTTGLTGDRRLPYGSSSSYKTTLSSSSCLFPTDGRSLRMSPSVSHGVSQSVSHGVSHGWPDIHSRRRSYGVCRSQAFSKTTPLISWLHRKSSTPKSIQMLIHVHMELDHT